MIKRLTELGDDREFTVFTNPSFDNSIVGISSDDRVIYDYDKMVIEYTIANSVSEEEAMEFIDYNTIRALDYMGEKAPIVMYTL